MTNTNTPWDWENPDFNLAGKQVHEWKSYVSPKVQYLWDTFTNEQKQALSELFEDLADREEWD